MDLDLTMLACLTQSAVGLPDAGQRTRLIAPLSPKTSLTLNPNPKTLTLNPKPTKQNPACVENRRD